MIDCRNSCDKLSQSECIITEQMYQVTILLNFSTSFAPVVDV